MFDFSEPSIDLRILSITQEKHPMEDFLTQVRRNQFEEFCFNYF